MNCAFTLIGGSDYTALTAALTFSPLSAADRQCQVVTINPDDVLEVDESFFVVLRSTDRAFNSLPVQSTVNIEDSTGMFIIP